MNGRLFDHIYILATVVFTVYSQLIMRWQVSKAPALPDDLMGKLQFLMELLLNPWVLSGVVATLFAGLSWMMAMSRFQLSYAFPFVSLNYVLVLAAGVLLFGETFSASRVAGVVAILVGLVILSRS
jgi:drug/metabolite transporter (DMT)-like permease